MTDEIPKKILLITDAWFPQINGVVRTYDNTIKTLESAGHQVDVIHPSLFKNFPAPLYPEIRLAFPRKKFIRDKIRDFRPDHIHIATEGPIGLRARLICGNKIPFSSSFHTMFPDYMQELAKIPVSFSWKFLKWFHGKSSNIMAPTNYVLDILRGHGLNKVKLWSRGINQEIFYPHEKIIQETKPVIIYIGRISKEKNIEEFLKLEIDAVKYVVGDGPARKQLEAKYPEAKFVGFKKGHELASYFSSADVFVFPSKTDTFGNVVLESLACGTPVAAYPLAGPLEVIKDPRLGAVSNNLTEATELALKHGDSNYSADYAKNYSWENATKQFLNGLVASHL